jgi:hypothetical protein
MHAGESVEDAGIRYFNKQLKDHPAKRNEPGFEEVGFYRSGQTKFKSSHLASQETWKLLPAARPIIEEGYYVGSHELTEAEKSSRKDGVVKFHYFEANVDTPEGKKYIGVTVNEDYRGKKFYNLNEDPDVLWRKSQAKNKTADLAENSARGGGLKDSASGTLDGSIAEEGAEINIWVL